MHYYHNLYQSLEGGFGNRKEKNYNLVNDFKRMDYFEKAPTNRAVVTCEEIQVVSRFYNYRAMLIQRKNFNIEL